jgi:hypothetical protein
LRQFVISVLKALPFISEKPDAQMAWFSVSKCSPEKADLTGLEDFAEKV